MKKLILVALMAVAVSCSKDNGGKSNLGSNLIGEWVAPDITDADPYDMKVIGKKNITFQLVYGSAREGCIKDYVNSGNYGYSAYYIPKEGNIQVAQAGYLDKDQYVYEYSYWFKGEALHFKYVKTLQPGFTDIDTPGTEYVYYKK